MKKQLGPIAVLMMSACLLMGGVQAVAADAASAEPSAAAKTKKKMAVKEKAAKAAKGGATAKFMPGSQETPKERSTRLKRECKGAVNAGVCTGYTTP